MPLAQKKRLPESPQPESADALKPEWLFMDRATKEYPFSRSTLYRLSAIGRVTIRKLGDRNILHRSELERLLEDLPRLPPTNAT